MSKYESGYEWGTGARTRLILLIVAAVAIFVAVGIAGYDRTRKAEFIGQELTVEDLMQQAEDPDSYRF